MQTEVIGDREKGEHYISSFIALWDYNVLFCFYLQVYEMFS